MLKSSAIIRRFQIFILVSLRYFKAEWEVLEYMFINQKISPLLKNEVIRISLWSITSFWIEKQREESLILMYTATLGYSDLLELDLINISQLGWFTMPTRVSPLQFEELRIEWIEDQEGS